MVCSCVQFDRRKGESAPGKVWRTGCAHKAKNSDFDAKNSVFGSKRAEIEGLMLPVS
jgi:hypothetical protein